MNMIRKSKKTMIRWILVVCVVLGGILYLLADRYLIQRVEIDLVNAATDVIAVSNMVTDSPVNEYVTTATDFPALVDDWNYQNGSIDISIEKVTTGSGNNRVTYFVANVVLLDATRLESAFANDQFGRNIIEYTSEIAANHNAIFAINGDYYGFRNEGARTGLAFYQDGSMKIYDETQTSAEALLAEGVWNTLSFGPVLIENSVLVNDFSEANVDHNLGNHSIIGANPRTGVGIIDNNHFVFVVVDGRSPGYSLGVTLTEFAQVFKDLGCTNAYNIDGGGSSTMFFMGRVVNNPLGQNRERGTSDILYISE